MGPTLLWIFSVEILEFSTDGTIIGKQWPWTHEQSSRPLQNETQMSDSIEYVWITCAFI